MTDTTPAASPETRRALVHNAITNALSAAGDWVPLSVRIAATRAALAEVDAWHASDTAAPAVEPPADDIRDQLLHAFDHAYTTGVLGYGTPEELLAAYDTSRTSAAPATDHTAPPAWVDGHPQLEAIAAAVWEQCARSDSGLCVEDDPRTIAVAALAAVLPAPADRRGVLTEAESAIRTALGNCGYKAEDGCDFCNGVDTALVELRRLADETATTETPAEDPARIDRLRPEFTEHASVESIDAQLDRARRQERRWHLRVEWLIGLRQARTEQPAAGARQDGARCTCQYIAESWIQMDHADDCPAAGARQDEAQP